MGAGGEAATKSSLGLTGRPSIGRKSSGLAPPSGFAGHLPMNGEELPSVDSAAGFNPAATLSLASAKRRYEQLFRKIPTVYRKESSACGEAARAMRGNHLGSPS